MNYLETAAQFLADRFEEHASIEVVYRRDGFFEFTSVKATPGSTPTDVETASGIMMRVTSTDFSIKQSYLQGYEPTRGDKIEYTFQGKRWTYTVQNDGNLGAYAPSDSYGISYRIRAKLTKVEDAYS